MPTCSIATVSDESWPSVSIVKNAWPKFLTGWAAGQAAEYTADNLTTLAQLDRASVVALVSKAHDRSRDGAASRGTAVHALLEALAVTDAPDALVVAEARDWASAARSLIDELQPEWLLSEAVVINRTLAIGGTLDAVWRVHGRTYMVDFKSRALGKHDVYPDEAAQMGAYASADYAIVNVDGRAVRRRLPELDGGLLITIDPARFVLTPIDLPVATQLFASLRDFWQHMQDDKPVGKPIVLRPDEGTSGVREPRKPTPVAPTMSAAVKVPDVAGRDIVSPLLNEPKLIDAEALRTRVRRIMTAGHVETLLRLWPPELRTLKSGELTQDELHQIERLISRTEAEHAMPFGDSNAEPAEKYRLLDGFAPDEQAALVAEAGQGRDILSLTEDDVTRLRALVEGIDLASVAFTYDAQNRPQLVHA